MTEAREGAGPTRPVASAAHGEGRLRVEASAIRLGRDLVVAIWGGTHPHVGSVVVAEPRPSRARPGSSSSTCSVINRLGHEDETVARLAAERLAREMGTAVVVAAGLHVDDATPEEIAALLSAAERCVDLLLIRVRGAGE